MELGFVGLGRMGSAMTRRLVEGGHRVVAYDRSAEALRTPAVSGVEAVESPGAVAAGLKPPRAVWLMVPAGEPTEEAIRAVAGHLGAGDLVVDGGNSYYRDSIRRSATLRSGGIDFVDVGTSGGVWGYEAGFCLMAGGSPEAVARIEPALRTLAPPGGYARVGGPGAGHFAKMIHNGIEYGLLQAYGEGFEILAASDLGFDLHQLAALWGKGSVVRSWLLELLERALGNDPKLESVRGFVEDSGEGRWTVAEAIDLDVPAPVITLSLLERFRSRQEESFAAKVIAALRREFGGHAVKGE